MMPNPGDLVVPSGKYVGPQGPEGPQGPQGPSLPPPAGAGTWGRLNALWTQVLPLTGGALSNGLNFGSAVAGSPTDISRHVALWGGAYGFCVTGNTLNYNSGGIHQLFSNGLSVGAFQSTGLQLSTDNWNMNFNRGNGDLIFYNYAGSSLFGWYGALGFTIWGDLSNSGTASTAYCSGRGVVYYNIGGNGWNFNWDGSYVYGRVDNAIQWPFLPSTCDAAIKQDIAPSSFGCLDAIRRIRLWQFRWMDHTTPGKPKRTRRRNGLIPVGFVAQRLYEDCPTLVNRPKKDPDIGAMALWNIDDLAMMATLVGAVKELDASVAALRQAG